MKRDMNIVKQILTIIADSPTRRVATSSLKIENLEFHLLLMEKKGYLVIQEVNSKPVNCDYQVNTTWEVYLTWEGYDFLETLNKELQQPLNEKTESTANFQSDILEVLNENILKEIDEEEWNKVLNRTQYNFLVIEIFEDYGHMEEINYIQKFQSRLEAEAFIEDAKNKYKESFNNKYNYIKSYITDASQETIDEIVKQLVFYKKSSIDYIISVLSQTESVVVEGYNPPKVTNYSSNFYHILEIKEN